MFRLHRPPHESLLKTVHDELFHVWSDHPGAFTFAEASNGDPVLKEFAASLNEHYHFIDLREPRVGMGFSWGRYGADTLVRRHGEHRLFAYARSAKRSVWARLFGR